MEFKAGITLLGIRPELVLGLMVADTIYQTWQTPLVITKVTGGEHQRASLHYAGAAADLRSRTLPEGRIDDVVAELTEALGDQFDVVKETDHIHVEWQPK